MQGRAGAGGSQLPHNPLQRTLASHLCPGPYLGFRASSPRPDPHMACSVLMPSTWHGNGPRRPAQPREPSSAPGLLSRGQTASHNPALLLKSPGKLKPCHTMGRADFHGYTQAQASHHQSGWCLPLQLLLSPAPRHPTSPLSEVSLTSPAASPFAGGHRAWLLHELPLSSRQQ